MGAEYADPQYLAEIAALRNDVINRYQPILSELGYQDPSGNFIRGSLEIQADIDREAERRQQEADVRNLEEQLRMAQNWFSGYHGTEQAAVERPHIEKLASIDTILGQDLSERLLQAQSILQQYGGDINVSLQTALDRAAQRAGEQGGGTEPAAAAPAAPTPAAAKPAGKPDLRRWKGQLQIRRGNQYVSRKQFLKTLGPNRSKWAKAHPKAAKFLNIK
jgi:hypothetical protein